jgi:hypothetical protein
MYVQYFCINRNIETDTVDIAHVCGKIQALKIGQKMTRLAMHAPYQKLRGGSVPKRNGMYFFVRMRENENIYASLTFPYP